MQNKSTPNPAETTDAPKTISAPGITLDEALAMHNAKHPESRLVDITDALDTAAADRLPALLTAREAGRPAAQQNVRELIEEGSTPRERVEALLFFAALRFSLKGKPRATERMSAILKGPRATPETRADVGRAERVWHLLHRLVRTGCQKRGEGA